MALRADVKPGAGSPWRSSATTPAARSARTLALFRRVSPPGGGRSQRSPHGSTRPRRPARPKRGAPGRASPGRVRPRRRRDEDARRRVASDPSAFEGRGLGREVIAVLRAPRGTVRAPSCAIARAAAWATSPTTVGYGWPKASTPPSSPKPCVPPSARGGGVSRPAGEPRSRTCPAGARRPRLRSRQRRAARPQDRRGSRGGERRPHPIARHGRYAGLRGPARAGLGGQGHHRGRRLRAGIDADAFIRRLDCRGPERFGKGILWCSYPAGPFLGLDQAMAVSCNMAFAHLGWPRGRAALVDEFHRWGFDHDFTVAPAGHIVRPPATCVSSRTSSIGLEATDITPLHGALLGAVLADAGRMPEPVVLEAEEGPMGLEPRPMPAAACTRRPRSFEAIPVLARAMLAVATRGTAAGTTSLDFPVAMKTGTGAEWRRATTPTTWGSLPGRIRWSPSRSASPTSRRRHRVNQTARAVLAQLLDGLRRRHRLRARTSEAPHTAGL